MWGCSRFLRRQMCPKVTNVDYFPVKIASFSNGLHQLVPLDIRTHIGIFLF